ncbi:cytochrome c [Aquincola sp. S2]|uniref:Cytochrome c n=1 Tax=Pseudaquabacterium terrae TaxID=2732868 RepID=A0ABX2EPL6_9BURK|nr:cytochrome c [Aquabacterium terrae]NRF70581.1 cytochrome c [Aquabacterium terrae]
MPAPFPRALVLAAALALPALAHAQQPPKPEQLIKWRQSAYQTIAWNVARIKSNVDGSFQKDEVARAAAIVAALANGGLGSLFRPGTETGKGWHETTVKPTLFSDGSGVGAKSAAFAKEASELHRVALTGDLTAIKAQFGNLQRSCKACHDDYRN